MVVSLSHTVEQQVPAKPEELHVPVPHCGAVLRVPSKTMNNNLISFRFTRELQNLKKMADYSSKDTTNLNGLLQNIAAEFSIYTYSLLNVGVDRDTLRNLKEDQLSLECGISNSIHRLRILDTIKGGYLEIF